MLFRHLLAVAPLLFALPATVQAQPVQPAELMRHIEILASDDFEGRKPGTPGETRTLHYIATQLASLGLQPAAGNGSWYQPVGLVERKAVSHRVQWRSGSGAPIAFNDEQIILRGREASASLRDAPVVFVGHGLVLPDREIDQTRGADLSGSVAVLYSANPDVPDAPNLTERLRALTAAGAAAVIVLVPDQQWPMVPQIYRAGNTVLQDEDHTAPVQGALSITAIQSLLVAAGSPIGFDAANLITAPVQLPLRLSADVTSGVNRYNSYNVIGRLPGRGRTGENVLMLGHWDHLGICRPPEVENRICNGAVDNASGIAVIIEATRRLAQRRPQRDLIVIGTTAEEMGLLGAEYFARHPTVPLETIVAAVNIDTVAIHDNAGAVSYAGRGNAALDQEIVTTVRQMRRVIDPAMPADAYAHRQDGWVLAKRGVPTVGLLGGSFADEEALKAFLAGPYHKPEDDLRRPIALKGAAEDADLHIALLRRLANPRQYRPVR